MHLIPHIPLPVGRIRQKYAYSAQRMSMLSPGVR
jgi:hypothetical protein